jgi:phosphate transport system substrate-binding protein
MAHRNKSLFFALALIVTIGIFGSAGWWLFNRILGGTTSLFEVAEKNPLLKDSLVNPIDKTLASVDGIPQGSFRYGGSTTWTTIRAQVDRSIQIVHPSFQINYRHPVQKWPSSGAGIEMLLNGDLDFAQSSRALPPQKLETAPQRGISLKQIAVAIDGIAIAVHLDLSVTDLTLDQLHQIYTGGPSNWREFGGPDQLIVHLLRKGSGSIDAFLGHGKKTSDIVTEIAMPPEALQKVAATPGALYFTSFPGSGAPTHGQNSGDRNNGYNLCPRCAVPRNAQTAGEAYTRLLLSDQSQELIAKANFVRIR